MPSIVGTWKMVGAAARDRDGKALPAPYGGKGMGRVAFTAEGRMMAVTCDGRPELTPGTARAYSSYCGNYTFDGARLVTRVDASSDPARIGGDQVREVSFDGDTMILRPPPRQTEAGQEYIARSAGCAFRASKMASVGRQPHLSTGALLLHGWRNRRGTASQPRAIGRG